METYSGPTPVVAVDIRLGKMFSGVDIDIPGIAELMKNNGAADEDITQTTINVTDQLITSRQLDGAVFGHVAPDRKTIELHPLSGFENSVPIVEEGELTGVYSDDFDATLLHELGHRLDFIKNGRKYTAYTHVLKVVGRSVIRWGFPAGAAGYGITHILNALDLTHSGEPLAIVSSLTGLGIAGLARAVVEMKRPGGLALTIYNKSPLEREARRFEETNKGIHLMRLSVTKEKMDEQKRLQELRRVDPNQQQLFDDNPYVEQHRL